MDKVFVYDPTASDKQSAVRGVGRYLQIMKENFPEFKFVSDLGSVMPDPYSIFINPFINFLQPPLTLRRIAKKQIAVIHDLIPLKYPEHFPAGIRGGINIALNKFALKNYDLIITVSEASKQDIINILHINKDKIKVIYHCLPKSFKVESSKYQVLSKNMTTNYKLPTTAYCIYVGDATWNKNLVNMAQAIKIANVTCVFVGKKFESFSQTTNYQLQTTTYLDHPWQKELKEFYELAKGDKRFIFAGYISDSELIKFYKQASINLLLSRDEGFGFSFLEAAVFGCPSLLAEIPALREISAGSALYVNQKDPEKIAKKIKEISNDKILRKRLSEVAKKRSEFFNASKFRKEFLSCLK